MENKTLMQTYVGKYFISTIDRDSSCAMQGRYAETIVFTRTDPRQIMEMYASPEGDIEKHLEVCRNFYEEKH